jgi:hypothetical protein
MLSEKTERSQPSREAPSEIPGLQSELALLQQQIGATNAKIDGLSLQQSKPDHAPIADPLASASEVASVAEARAASREERRAQIAEIDARFSLESMDIKWAAVAKAAILDAVRKNQSISVRNIDCREKSCRVELADDSRAGEQSGVSGFARECGSTLPNVVADHIDGANGHDSYVLYMSRVGFEDDSAADRR